MNYLVFDVGCIECGEESAFIGLFDDLEKASEARFSAHKEQVSNWHGEHHFGVWDVKTKQEVDA